MRLTWCDGGLEAACPVCGRAGVAARVVEATLAGGCDETAARVAFLRCAACATVFAAGDLDPDYGDVGSADEIVRYYVEHLAAIDTVIDPLFKIDRDRVRRYGEIGCSFGFSLDFAREMFGWDVRGIEPGSLGRAGAPILALPIEHRMFSEAEPLGGESADLLVATEVIEHIRDPHAFMRGVIASLAPDGILVLSTPNALAITAQTGDSDLGQILCPGYHLVLYTPDSLAQLVAAHGLTHHACRTTATGIVMYASRAPFRYAPEQRTDRAAYTRYLECRLGTAEAGSALARGMAYRLMREHAMFGQWDRAVAFVPRLVALYQAGCAIDLLDPAGTQPDAAARDMAAFARRYPFNLSGVFYALGMLDLLHRHDDRRAVAYFDASTRWADALDSILRPHGIADAEAWMFRREAHISAVRAEARYDPVAALARVLRLDAILEDDATAALAGARRAVFVELVARGEHRHAAGIAAEVTGTLCLSAPGSLDAEDECRGCYSVGIYALLHLGDHAIARPWLARAVNVMEAAPENTALRSFGQAARAALVHAAPTHSPETPRFRTTASRWRTRLASHWLRVAG